jgi:general secretion pathway protein C
VVEIEKKRVVLERNGGREILVFDEKEAPPKRGGTVSKATKTDDESGISEAGDNKFTIPRETLDKYIGDLDAIGKMGRARPHRDENGKTDGFRLSGIRRNSLGSKLGIKTGDVVHSVNGKGLTNAKEAMEAWQTLQNDNSFSFEITRRGKKQTMEYTVR